MYKSMLVPLLLTWILLHMAGMPFAAQYLI